MGNLKYDNYCANCFYHLFPNDDRISKMRIKSKEIKVINFILKTFPDIKWIYDKPIYVNFKDNCCVNRRRIDIRVLI